MRVRIVFSLKNKGATAPFHHQHLLAHMVREVLADEKTGKYLDYDYYNFSGLKGQIKVTPVGLAYYSSKVTLVMASPSQLFIDAFLQALFRRAEVIIGQLVLVPESVSLEESPQVEAEMQKYVCISPIVIASPRFTEADTKRFVPPDSDFFSDILYESTMGRMEASGAFTPEQIAAFYRFQVVPDKDYLAKIRSTDKKFARIYALDEGLDRVEVRGYTFPFTLYAAPDVHTFIFECGLGEYCNRGFGMLDNVENQFHTRISDYHFEARMRYEHQYAPRERVA